MIYSNRRFLFAASSILIWFSAADAQTVQEGSSMLMGVVQSISGEVISSGSVVLVSVAGGPRQEAKLDEAGGFRFSGLRAGTYLLSIRAGAFDGIKVKQDLLDGERKLLPPVRLNLAPSGGCFSDDADPDRSRFLSAGSSLGALAGTVRDGAGAIAGARVTLACWLGYGCSNPGALKTDSDGNFMFDDIHPGRYVLNIEQEGFFSLAALQVVVVAGLESSYAFTLAECPNGSCTVKPPGTRAAPVVCE
jgi:Carboxypeptidase regulatory-like domain